MRLFELHRDADETGVSGTGVVAEGAEFTDGTAVVRWRTEYRSTAVYSSMYDVVAVHGHGGKTRVVWCDDDQTALRRLAEFCNGWERKPETPPDTVALWCEQAIVSTLRQTRSRLIHKRALETFDEENAHKWLAAPLMVFGMKTANEMLETDDGADAVWNVLGRIDHGVVE